MAKASANEKPSPPSYLTISHAISKGRELPPLIICKASQSRRAYMRKRYGHRFTPGQSKSVYLPPQVIQELSGILRELEKNDPEERPYIYPYEILHDLLRNA